MVKPQPASPGTGLRINQPAGSQDSPKRERRLSIEDLPSVKTKIKSYITAAEDTPVEETKEEVKPRPILKKEDKERSRSPRKNPKAPRKLSEHFLNPNQSVEIYAQSATDMSATEDESEMSQGKSRAEPKKLSVVLAEQPEPGPILLQVPPKPTAEARPGIMKSKSFASSSGQYECSINDSSGKKMQMMQFFREGGKPQQQKTVRIKEKVQRSSSITSISDEIMAEEDMVDIDAEFESLLNQTFEKESRRLMTSEQGHGGRRAGEKAESAGGQRRGRGTVSMDMSSAGPDSQLQHNLRKSSSFAKSSTGGDPVNLSPDVAEGKVMFPSPVIRQRNFDPLAALPTSQGRREGQHSPSPTQSEYDTCDPWDDY
jgi:hypothetical protein